MTIEKGQIVVRGIPVEVVRKDIKNLHLAVYPPAGRIRIAVPLHLKDEAVRLALVSRLGWIRRQQGRFERQERQSEREMTTGEAHYLEGRRYRLVLVKEEVRARIKILNNRTIELHVRPGMTAEKRRAVLSTWYRQYLRARIPALIGKWEPIIGVRVMEWRIKRMKTRWGTCTPAACRIWVNLELAKKPLSCLEFIVVHEMIHLLERRHNERFQSLMDEYLPAWRRHRDELNRAPLANEDWRY